MLRLSRLSFLLHGLQAIVIRQDSLIEAQRQQLGEQKGKQAPKESPLVEQERLRSLEKQREELVGLGRQHSLLQEEFQRCRKACEEKGQELRALEARLLDSERSKAELEREREEWRRSSGGPEPETPVATEQLRRKPRSHARQFSLPSAQFTCLGMTPRQSSLQRRRSADESCLRGALTSEGPFDPPSASTDQSEGSGLPWPTGREAPLRTDCEAGAERGPAPDASLCLREESSGEESRSPSPSSSESSEEVTDMEQPQNIPEGSGSGQPAPAGGDPAPQPEDDEDDLYY
ncbi:rho guanine nucleotide exchange factor 2-like [Heptranchias perlo]|uniref:rho guanine nucleotide exchange factor 2-like n=1 Tax=Heptranchias perlo TaxID=212740 RepID=UPI003559D663